MAEEGDPEALQQLEGRPEPPEIDHRWRWIWRAWATLSRDRGLVAGGMGPVIPLPLPWLLIEQYADRLDCDAAERATLHHVLGKLDETKLKHDGERMREKMEGSNR